MTRFLLGVLVLVGAAACTDFDDVPRGVCGNGVLEPGEDCDQTGASCVRCAVTCTTAADCPNDGYTCGVDGFCHAAGGELGQATAPVTLQADHVRITDVDHDGIGDVIGLSRTSLVVRLGDPAGSLTASNSFVTPFQSGPPAFGDLDGDGSLDVMLSTPDGLVTYSSEYGGLSPKNVVQPLYGGEGVTLDVAAMFALSPTELGVFLVDNGAVFFAALDLVAGDARSQFDVPCVARLGVIQRDQFDVASIELYTPRGANPTEHVISFRTTSGQVCVIEVDGDAPGIPQKYVITDITPANVGSFLFKPVLADLDADNDPCPGLVSSNGGAGALRLYKGRMVNTGVSPHCAFDPAVAGGAPLPGVTEAPPSAIAIGRVPIEPAILFSFFASDALALSSGLYAYKPALNQFDNNPLYTSSRPLARITAGDIDADGDVDAVAVPAGEEDLDVLYRYPTGVAVLRLDTAGRVTTVTLGDYDANSHLDIAYSEIETDHERLMVAYGTADRPLPGVQVATFENVASVARIAFPDTSDPLSVADDLFVIEANTMGPSAASLLHGSLQRTMLSFFDPRSPVSSNTLVRGAVIGNFASSPQIDLVMIGTELTPGTPIRAWNIAGTPNGLDPTQIDGTMVNGLAECQAGGVAGSGVCVHDALYLPWPTAVGRDIVFAIDGVNHAAVIDPWAPSPAAMPQAAITAGLPAGVIARSMYAADVDGDTAPELVVSFAAPPGSPTAAGQARVCKVSGSSVQSCEDLMPAIALAAPDVTACIDAAPARVTLHGPTAELAAATDLVVLCRSPQTTSLYRVTRDGTGYRATPLAQSTGLRAIRVDDVTGDGIDDVIAMQGDGGASAAVVFAQCSSRELASCRGTSSSEGAGQ